MREDMEEIVKIQNEETEPVPSMTIENRLEIIEEGMHKNYLARLNEMKIVPVGRLAPLEEDLIDNVRLYHITRVNVQQISLQRYLIHCLHTMPRSLL